MNEILMFFCISAHHIAKILIEQYRSPKYKKLTTILPLTIVFRDEGVITNPRLTVVVVMMKYVRSLMENKACALMIKPPFCACAVGTSYNVWETVHLMV